MQMIHDTEAKFLAMLAYQAYGNVTDFKNFRGDPMPKFGDLPEKIQQAWIAAVSKVIEAREGSSR